MIEREDVLSESDLGGDKGEVAGVGTRAGAALTPVDEAQGVRRVLGQAEGVDEGGGEGGLLEPVRAAFPIEGREDEPDGAKVVPPRVHPVQ